MLLGMVSQFSIFVTLNSETGIGELMETDLQTAEVGLRPFLFWSQHDWMYEANREEIFWLSPEIVTSDEFLKTLINWKVR